MKPIYKLLLLALLLSSHAMAQPFVTVWNLATPGSSPTGLSFGVGTTGVVNYTWETILAGMSGSGTFTGTTATITGLPAGTVIRLTIDTFSKKMMKEKGDFSIFFQENLLSMYCCKFKF